SLLPQHTAGMLAPATIELCTRTPEICVPPVGPLLTGPVADIRVPALVVVGERDPIVCGGTGLDCSSTPAAKATEAPHWSPEACLGVRVLPDVGHDINLRLVGLDWYDSASEWTTSLLEWRNGSGVGCPAL